MTTERKILIAAPELHDFMIGLMVASGMSDANAKAAADVHIDAELRGVGIQGFDYLPYTLASLERGLIEGKAEPRLTRRTQATALIDGGRGPGQAAAIRGADLAVEIADTAGTATVAVRNSTDIFMLAFYAERIAKAGKVGIVVTSGPPLVHPPGGMEKLLSTNPLAFAFPRARSEPFVFDMATSALASSRVRQAAYDGTPLPEGSGIGPDGVPTTEAALVRKGAISPLAGHKGFGLALCVGLLCGPLTDSGIGPELAGWQGAAGETKSQGHLIMAIDPTSFGDAETFAGRTDWYLDLLKDSRTAPGSNGIRIPGERAAAERMRRKEKGVEILAATWRNVQPFAERLGVAVPSAFRQENAA